VSPENFAWKVLSLTCAMSGTLLPWAAPAYAAENEVGSPAESWDGPDSSKEVDALPTSPRSPDFSAVLLDGWTAEGPGRRGLVAGLGGFDGLRASGIFQSRTEIRLTRALTLTGGFALESGSEQSRIQPRVGLKLQLLSQVDSGVGLAVGGGYRRDRYAQDDGMVEAFVAVGRTVDRVSWLANLSVGSDLEGDDRKGDLQLSAMRSCGRARQWRVGMGLKAELDLASFDPRRAMRSDSNYEGFAGPMATYELGSWALLVEGGSVLARTDRTLAGLATLGGVATIF
jgi:hypothetical protein